MEKKRERGASRFAHWRVGPSKVEPTWQRVWNESNLLLLCFCFSPRLRVHAETQVCCCCLASVPARVFIIRRDNVGVWLASLLIAVVCLSEREIGRPRWMQIRDAGENIFFI